MSVFLHRVGLLRPLAAAPSGYSFTMTAGDLSATFQGYSNGGILPAMGSIDAEPIPGETLSALIDGSSNAIAFVGDLTAELAGLTVWVDSVEYPFDGSDWNFDDDFTSGTWSAAGPSFTNTVEYFVEIK